MIYFGLAILASIAIIAIWAAFFENYSYDD